MYFGVRLCVCRAEIIRWLQREPRFGLKCCSGCGGSAVLPEILLWLQGEFAAAARIHRDTMAQKSRVLGPEHPATLTSASNLAGVLRSMGELAAAERISHRTHKVRRRTLGPEHPDTLASANNLANLLWQQQGDEDGEPEAASASMHLDEAPEAATRRAAALVGGDGAATPCPRPSSGMPPDSSHVVESSQRSSAPLAQPGIQERRGSGGMPPGDPRSAEARARCGAPCSLDLGQQPRRGPPR